MYTLQDAGPYCHRVLDNHIHLELLSREPQKVAVAEGIVSFGVQTLWELLSRESERLWGVDEQVVGLKHQLGRLQSLLKDEDARKYESERVRSFLEDVKDIVYDAEDIIESFLMKEGRGKEKGIKKHVRKLACFLVDRRKFASDIKGITKRISEVIAGMHSFGILQIIDSGRSLCLQERQREIRLTFPDNSECDLIGVEHSLEELVGHLVDDDNSQLLSISGMGGIGKTTLARQVFHHDTVRRHFDGFAWVCVSQQFTQKHIWQRILQNLRPQDEDFLQMDTYTLQGKLFELLATGRYLIVLDDVWKAEDWDRIKAVFPQKRGWKILLTSRNEGVGLHADPACFAFRPKSLTPEQSWTLCRRIAFPRRNDTELTVDGELEAMGKEMVTYCGGLPLAVKVLGGLLAMKPSVPEWKRVSENIESHIVGGSGVDDNNINLVYRVLSLSYEDLPVCLKHCFLYLAHFPEDYKISVGTLFNYWAADGIIMSYCDGATIRDAAEGYLEELMKRNMVTTEINYATSKFEYCQMHDMMRGVCLSKAKEENFVKIIKAPNIQSHSRSRRLAVHSGNAFEMLGNERNKKVRSLLYFGIDEDIWMQSASRFRSVPLLRVLDLYKAKFQGGKLPPSIGELIHLRFLSLHMAGVSHIPSSLRKLKRLLYLNLYVCRWSVHVPNVLNEMLELRYLILPMSMDDDTRLELGNLLNLETLWCFSTKHSSVTDLLRMTKLRTLSIYLHDGYTYEALSSSLSELRYHEHFSLHDRIHDTRVADGSEFVLDFIHLNHLALFIHMPRLPDQHRFPLHLAHIRLGFCSMKEDPMPILEKLPHLKWVELLYGAFSGKRMVCSEGGFPQLCVLQLLGQDDLEEWIVEEGSIPYLHTFSIRHCKKLKELPDGLKYLTFLKELRIGDMKRRWKERLFEGGENYYKVQHIPLVDFLSCDEE